MKKRLQSGFRGLRIGGFWGAILGAIALGLVAFFNETSYYYGTARMWMWFFMIEGLIWGTVVGAILGAVIGVSKTNA